VAVPGAARLRRAAALDEQGFDAIDHRGWVSRAARRMQPSAA
jgi:hypothetical protein